MFTTKDKVKELVEFLLHGQNVSCLVCKNKMYAPVGVSVVMTYKFEVKDMEIIYDKWFVEDFEDASKMQLPGCEHHDQLVKGSGVTVLSKKMGSFIFHGNKANEIINACEIGRDMTSHIMKSAHTFTK